MKKLVYIYVFMTFIGSIRANDRGVEVRPTGRELIETEPKKIVTTVFRVTNTGSEKQEFISEVELPEGWGLITPEFPFEMDENQSAIKFVSFYIPRSTLSGTYDLTYRVQGREFPEIGDYYTIQIRVLPKMMLDVSLLEVPTHVVAGEEYQAHFIIENGSNLTDTVGIEVISGEDYAATCDVKRLVLIPGESKHVDVLVKTCVKTKRALKHNIQLIATSKKNKKIRAKAASLVEIIPRGSGVEDPFHRVPVSITARQVMTKNNETRSGFQAEIEGKGKIDENGDNQIHLRLRGPDIYKKSYLAQRDEYFISYWNKKVALHVGDRAYSLSPLTERFRYGRGAEGEIKYNRFRGGMYYLKTLWLSPEVSQVGTHLHYNIKKKSEIGLNYLLKKTEGNSQNILSLSGQLRPLKDTDVELEYAVGKGGKKTSTAHRLWIYGRNKRASYLFHSIHAAKDFPGYYRDTNFISGSLSLNIVGNLRINAAVRQQRQNIDTDTTRYIAPLDKYYQWGLYYRWKNGTHVTIDWIDQSREDRLPVPKFNYRKRTIRLGVGHSYRAFSFHATAESGIVRNNLIEQSYTMNKLTATLLFKPSDNKVFQGYVYCDDSFLTTGGKQSQITVGTNVTFRVANKTHFYFDFQSNHSLEEYYRDRNIIELRLKHVLFDKHMFSMRGRHTMLKNSINKRETALLVEYSIPLGISTGKKKNTGIIKGTIYDAENQKALKDVIIRMNGATAITNRMGRYVFPSLMPGTYYLSVDRISIGNNQITDKKTPMEVAVKGGEEKVIDIGITTSAKLVGRVMLYGINEDNININRKIDTEKHSYNEKLFIQDHGLKSVLVEIKKDDEIQRRLTDRTGKFSFEKIRPGVWTIKIYESKIPKYHYIKRDSFIVELKPGSEKDILVKVLPKRRKIRMVEDGGILSQNAKPAVVESTESIKYYTVRPGDSLSKIAEKFYGNMMEYDNILHANGDRIKNADLIYPGQQIRIPETKKNR